MQGKYILLAIGLCLFVGNSVNAADVIEGSNYNVTAFCTMVARNSRLGSIVACDRYYVCSSSGPVQNTCTSGNWFDLSTSTCRPQSQVSCYIDTDIPCSTTSGKYWLPVKGTCNSYKFCKDGEYIGTEKCPSNTRFDYNSQACVWGSCTNPVSTSNEPTLVNKCDVVPPNKYFGSTLNCSLTNLCYGGELKQFLCPNSQPAFDVNNNYCTYTSNSVCSRVTGQINNPQGMSCTSGQIVGSTTVCANYQVCSTSGTFVTRACPSNQYFDANTKQCVLRQTATPTETCNRCQFSSKTFVNAVDTKCCAKYFYCNNGVASDVRSCPDGNYFNENVGGCMKTGLANYVASNGACKGVKALCAAATPTTTTTESTDSTDETTDKPVEEPNGETTDEPAEEPNVENPDEPVETPNEDTKTD